MKRFSLLLLVAILFAACTNDSIEELQSPIGTENYVPESITVGFEGDGDETRIQLQNGKTVWTKNDQVSVFYLSNANQKWQYYGETGSRTAELKRVDAGSGSTKINKVVVVYPYNEDYYINPESCNIKAFMPAEQTYLEDSYGTNGNIMISSSEYNQFSLKNVCGWLKLQLTGDAEIIKSIKFYGNNGEQVAGEMYIDSTKATATLASDMGCADDEENSAGGNLVFDDTILTEVTLNCGEGVELLPVATAFYIALPPQDFENGFTVEITDDNGYTMTQSTSKHVTIERNHIQPMTVFEFTNPNTPATPKPANNEIWYTATEKVDPIWDDIETFGANLKSNTWDATSGNGVYTFNGDVTMIGNGAFSGCKLKTVTLPESVTEIGSNAFKNCDSLKEVYLNNNLAIIKDSAFYDCDALSQITISNSVTHIEKEAFYDCDSLTTVIIGEGLTNLGNLAFARCDKLKQFKGKYASNDGRALVMDGALITYADASGTEYVIPNYVTSIYHDAFQSCKNLTQITIPDSVTTIGASAFYDCYALAKVNIGNGVTNIEKAAFQDCDNLTEVTIGGGMQEIGENAFRSCNKLQSITLPESVTLIGYDAFKECTALRKIYSLAVNPPTLHIHTYGYGYWPFDDGAEDRRIYVYNECVNSYKKAWNRYSSEIKPYEAYTGSDTTTIYYTTTDGEIVNSEYLSIKENTYIDGQGKMVICGKMEKLPRYAFRSANNLVSIIIPDGVTSVEMGAFEYSKNLESVTLPDSLTYIGDDAFYDCSKLTSITIPENVTDIGFAAFGNCSNLKEFKGKFVENGGNIVIVNNKLIAAAPKSAISNYTIPEYVTIIGNHAFNGCESLTNVTIPDSVTSIGNDAFYACQNLNSIVVGRGVEEIGYSAFAYCSDKLTIHMLPTTPPTLEEETSVFDGWRDYEDSYLKIFVPYASEYAYKSSWATWEGNIYPYDFDRVQTNYEIWYTSTDEVLVNPNNGSWYDANIVSNVYKNSMGIISFDSEITSVWSSMFSDCDNLISVYLPGSVTEIGDSAFSGCDYLTSVSLPNSVTSIGDNAFSDCWNLSSITIPDSVEEIGESVFEGCSNIIGFKGKYAKDNGKILVINGVLKALAYLEVEQYTIPDYVTEIGSYAFRSRYNLRSVTIPNSVTKIGKGAFYQCSNITSITIPDSVTTIGDYAFYNCSSLTSITIPDSVTSIGSEAFEYCSSLTSVTIGDSVTTIGDYAFEYCSSLTSVTIGDSVTSIGSRAFWGCSSLTSVYCKATTPPTLGGFVFDNNVSGRKIYVPAASVEAYKGATKWSEYASAIVGYDFENGVVVE